MAASATAVSASLRVAAEGVARPLALRPAASLPRRARAGVVVRASASQRRVTAEKAAAGLAAAAVAAALVLPEVAEAAPSLSPSLKNFLLSIASGGAVLVAIVGAVVAVSNFDPVKRA
ncbi:hypothetical protein GUJ93_ZPchr0003g18199 [Zizania palustris]|uniref:Ultraviolet-B-repressible protein n=1 Tax=Zizania palustris TaxID=103762 RepID=A0A8J5SML0_ZIZPA|nr:hypothetical protein GUJ93_ZPchr0003g18199 [Zizania palustris]